MKRWIIAAAVVGVALLAVGAIIFKPWLLFVDVAVDDAIPVASSAPAADGTEEATDATQSETNDAAAGPVLLASGEFVSHAHETSGIASIIENEDGTRVLTFENLDSTSGPDVHVWLSAAEVGDGSESSYDVNGAEFLDLGLTKGNLGNHVYEIPADVDLSVFSSISLWCEQFSVSFGAAPLS